MTAERDSLSAFLSPYVKALGFVVAYLVIGSALLLGLFAPVMITHNVAWAGLPAGLALAALVYLIAEDM